MEQVKQAVDSVTEGVKNVALGKQAPDGKKGGGRKDKKAAKESAAGAGGAATLSELKPRPDFIDKRLALFEELKKKQDEDNAKKPREQIMITMPDGSVKPGTAWETSPKDIAEGISKSLYKRACIAKVHVEGEEPLLWDLERPFEKSCKLEILDFNSPEGKQVFWHSSAHALGEASERCYGCLLSRGPPTEDGFFYDMAIPNNATVQATDWAPIESLFMKIAKEKQKFERLVMSKEDLLKMFENNEFKKHYIEHSVPDGTSSTVYRNGPFIDFCRGPHIPDTGRIEAFAIMRNSATYFLGDAKNSSLQRIVGISFPDKKLMAEHKKMLEEAAKRDHRRLGKDQELFFFHPFSPGSAFWQPHGMRVYDALVDYIKEEYWNRDYDMVKSPNVFSQELFETSGHWQHYREDMFHWKEEQEVTPENEGQPVKELGLKPMNCPGHALMFGERDRSYRELPLRYAENGVLHRNEASGALSGLTRVRRFEQDDSHIFCREDQIKAEMDDLFDFLGKFYGILGLTFKLGLSTRNPEKYMGSIEVWDRAEAMLEESLVAFAARQNISWEKNPEDAAFYGPKIDIAVLDCLKRSWQCATIQLDFLQPQNFSLEYATGESVEQIKAEHEAAEAKAKEAAAEAEEAAKAGKRHVKPLAPGYARPVMIHKAICGSYERFIAILMEHFAGKWPFWLSPRQILIIPVGKGFYEYGQELRAIFRKHKMYVDVDLSGEVLKKKIRTGQLAQYNFIFVVGDEEVKGRMVNVRYRDDPSTQDRGTPVPLDEAIAKLSQLKADRGMYNPFQVAQPPAEAK